MTDLLNYLRECDKYGHKPFTTVEKGPYNDDCFGIHNNHVIKDVETRVKVTNQLNSLLKSIAGGHPSPTLSFKMKSNER